MFRIPLEFHIEKYLIVFKSYLSKWILVILKVHPLIFYDFSLISIEFPLIFIDKDI